MEKQNLINGLRSLADELRPFTENVQAGSRVWNGTAYVTSELRQLDSYALMWWNTLTAIADLIEAQRNPLEPEQIEVLQKKLFGGMGSFSDYCIDSCCGEGVKIANARLNESRTKLFKFFPQKPPSGPH